MKQSYGNAVWRSLKEYAIWQPGDHTALGDYGVIREGCFTRIGNISDHIRNIEIQTKTYKLDHLSLSSKNTMERSPLLKDLVRLSMVFQKDHGVLLSARDIVVSTFLDLQKAARSIAGIDAWDRSWYVVTSVRNAGKFLLVISGDRKLLMEGPVTAVDQLLEGLPGEGTSVQMAGKISLRLVGENGPLSVRLHQLKSRGESFKYLEDHGDEKSEWVLAPFIDGIPEEQ